MKAQRSDDYLPGDFSFLKNENIISLTFDYNIINNLKAWTILKKNKNCFDSFMYNKKFDKIKSQMYPGHSGASVSLSLRTMEFIAKNGWEDYVFLKRD